MPEKSRTITITCLDPHLAGRTVKMILTENQLMDYEKLLERLPEMKDPQRVRVDICDTSGMSWRDRFWAWVERHPVLVPSIISVVAAVITSWYISPWLHSLLKP